VKYITVDLIEKCRDAKKIVIFGYPKTGKIKIAKELSEALQGRRLYKTDDYKNDGWSIDKLLEDTSSDPDPIIVEGIQTGRMLRKGFPADLIIKTKCNWKTIRRCYIADGESKKVPHIPKFNRFLDKVFRERKNKDIPIYEIETSLY
tara:strand:+ start:275 stop:715 length:441 start_codon:yes stop_codon:yes gene_type:complete